MAFESAAKPLLERLESASENAAKLLRERDFVTARTACGLRERGKPLLERLESAFEDVAARKRQVKGCCSYP